MEMEKYLFYLSSRIDTLEKRNDELDRKIKEMEEKFRMHAETVYNPDINYMLQSEVSFTTEPNKEILELSPENVSFTTNNEIRRILKIIAKNKLISSQLLEKLKDEEWCKQNLKLNFPLLRITSEGRYDTNNYSRYWDDEITIENDNYYISSQWFSHNRPRFEKWYEDFYEELIESRRK